MFQPVAFFLLFLVCQGALAQTTRDAALLASPAYPVSGPHAVEIRWEPAGRADSAVLRTWTSSDGLTGSDTFFQSTPTWMTPVPANDPTVEQEILQVVTIDTVRFLTSSYIRSGLARTGFQLPRRAALVVIDQEASAALQTEVDRLRDDLLREGWDVALMAVPADASVRTVKEAIYQHASTAARTESPLHVLLIGAIPYAMSGGYSTEGAIPNPDFHPEHGGAWASDAYYADTETSPGVDAEYQWTDDQVDLSDPAVAFRAENKNVPGDGKFDQSILPSDLELCIGRIDMRNLPAFGTDGNDRTWEFALLRRYLDKDHAYRTRQFVPPQRAVIDDNFQLFARQNEERRIVEAFASSGWRSFAPIVGADSILFGDWLQDSTNAFPALDTFPALLSYGCGGGGYEHCSYVITTEELARTPIYSTFTLLFGSYFGDVNSSNNLMRAVLANEGWGLTCGWSGRPHWFLHPLANGNTIGECQRLTANNNGSYWGATVENLETGTFSPLRLGERNIHILLLGDPTLTLQGPTIPGGLQTDLQPERRTMNLTWQRSPEHRSTAPDRVAYVIETSGPASSAYEIIDTVAPTNDALISAAIEVPAGHYRIRVRPYFTAEGRLAPLPGRGVVAEIPVLSVANDTHPANLTPRTWWVVDVMGRTVHSAFGTAEQQQRVLADSPLPSGVYILTDRRSVARKITFSR